MDLSLDVMYRQTATEPAKDPPREHTHAKDGGYARISEETAHADCGRHIKAGGFGLDEDLRGVYEIV